VFDISALNLFAFATYNKQSKVTFSDKIKNLLSFNDEVYKASGKQLNTRSARPGIPSYDYSPAYTNRLWLSWCYWYEDEVSILSDVLQKIRDEVMR